MTGALESQRSALARRGRRKSLRAVLFAGVSTVALTSAAFANPQGGEVVAGSATVTTPTSTTTQINQQSDKAIINWKSFNVDAGESTVFVQPNATSITLNRIFDSNPSVIAGLISANGQIILINRNGMMFQAGSRVDTAGLIASTADISNENFLSNKFQFDIAGTVGASITNEGAITAQPGGLVAIVAPTVENRGIITAKFGRVGLGAGSTFTLDLQGENLVSFPISEELAQQLTGGDFKGAEGKFVVLSSEAARSIIEDSLRLSTDTIATAVTTVDGKVSFTAPSAQSWLSASGGGTVLASGTVDVAGGSVALSGTRVDATGAIRADSASTRGGDVSINATGVATLTGSISANGSAGGSIDVKANNLLTAGAISADGSQGVGGSVSLTAASRQIATSATQVSANGKAGGGSISVSGGAGDGGGLFTSGTYTATSSAGIGGGVAFHGRDIKMIDSKADASGAAGGGAIAVGYSGEGASRAIDADNILVSPTSTFKADATEAGNGGSVIFWSNLTTDFMGAATARGGALSGNGGFLEISSKGEIGFWGLGDASAANGQAGQLLLDPKNIIVSSTGSTLPAYNLLDPNASAGNLFGASVTALSTGTTVVTATLDDFGAANAGAVYLFNTTTGALVSTLTGSTANDNVGSGGITVLSNGNFVVRSLNWDFSNLIFNSGAVTWGSGTTGVSGAVSSANSLVGDSSNDQIGSAGVVALTNGNYVVASPEWDNGSFSVGAVTLGNGATGTVGIVTLANSLTGSTSFDNVGLDGVVALNNGNYVVVSTGWQNGAADNAGAVTWRSGTNFTGTTVSAANSLVGSTTGDEVGSSGVTALTNGNYVVGSSFWNNGAISDAGAATWVNGATGATMNGLNTISSANSLVGTGTNNDVAIDGIVALSNGNYVVVSPGWDGAGDDRGAVTWGNGATGTAGNVTTANSLYGGTDEDRIGSGGVYALTNGHYVVASPFSDQGAGTFHGAVTWGNGTAATGAQVTAANSFIGGAANASVGAGGITVLTNGNYVIRTPNYDAGAGSNHGAVTWRNGSAATTGTLSAANSLIGSSGDNVGSAGVFALSNGNYVVASPNYDGGMTNRGAVTWGNGATGGPVGTLSSANSLIGGGSDDLVGSGGIIALTDGNYLILSPSWDGAGTDRGAATWASGTAATSGTISTANSIFGSTDNDQVGSGGGLALAGGNYVIGSPLWNNGATADVGAVTFGFGGSTTASAITAINSIIGGSANAQLTTGGSATTGEIFARSSASGTVFVGLTNPNQLTFNRALAQTLTVNPAFLTRTLNTGTAVTLQASNDLTVLSDIIVNNTGGNGGALTLQAGRSVLINADITTDNGNLTIVANEILSAGVIDAQRDPGSAVLTMGVGADINAGSGNVRLTIASGAGKTNTASGDMTLRNVSAGTVIAENLGPSNGDVILASGALTASGVGTPLVVASQGGDFINNAGAGALSASGGRWIVYSQNPAANVFGGLTASPYYNTVYNPAAPTALGATGNRFAYTIAPALTVTPDNQSREYGEPNTGFTYVITGLINGDTLAAAVSGTPTFSSTATPTSNVGSGYTITASLGTLVSDYNYGFNFGVGTLTINPATLTYVADAAVRAYGDPNPLFTGNVTGFKNGETIATATTGTLTFTSPATVTSNVGTYAIDGSGLTANNGNYVFVQAASNATALTINPATLLYVADPKTRLYGDANPALTGTVTGFKNSDTMATATTGTLAFSTSATPASNVGSYAILGSGLTTTSANYVLAQDPSNATALTINPATLTYIADPASRLYGDPNPAFTGTVTGFKNGETSATATTGTLTFTSPAVGTSNVGSYAIDGSGLVANNGNYVFVQAATNATALTINPATLTYIADPASRLYGDANPVFTGNVAGFKNGETIATATTGTLAFTTTATPASNVGSYAIDGSGLTANNGNYVFVQDPGNATALTINPATLTYIADPKTRIYGDANPALTGTVAGFKNGETIATATTGTLAFTTTATPASNVGSYAIDGSGLIANSGNYVFVQDAANATALTINPATLTYIADPASRLYGDANPVFTGTVAGFKNGETIGTATTGTLAFTTTATPTTNVGSYAIDGSGLTANNGNYVFVQDAANATALTINPATLTYIADPASRLYGDPNPAFTGNITGFKNGETIGTATTGTMIFTSSAVGTSNVGTYAINGSGLMANNGNYVFVQDALNATALTINPATLTYLADPKTRLYGDANPALTGVVTGFKNGETVATATSGTLTFTTPATQTSNVGIYAIDGSGLTANNGNYVFVQDAANATALTINPATLSYVADPKTRLYGDANPALTGTVTGFKNTDTIGTATTGTLTFTTAATTGSNVGTYAINGSGLTLVNANYVLVQAAGNATALTINPAMLTYLADPKTRLYGTPNPALTGTVTGFKNGETMGTATSGTLVFTTAATQISAPGTYAINGSGLTALNGNYVLVQDPSNATALTVDGTGITISALREGDLAGDGLFDYVEGDPAAKPSVLDIAGPGQVGTDAGQADLSDPGTKACIAGATNAPLPSSCNVKDR